MLVGPSLDQTARADSRSPVTEPTVVYFVEHGEPDLSDFSIPRDDLPLSETGWAYAQALTTVLTDVAFTNVSQSLWSDLSVVRMPQDQPGASTAAATESIVAAVTSLPPGSIALVGGNTENLFPMMSELGLPVQDDCRSDDQCLP